MRAASIMLRVLTPLLSGILALTAATGATAQAVNVVEYYNKTIDAYFLTGRAEEQSLLDGFSNFARTGMTFAATSASGAGTLSPVCRWRITVTGSNWAVNPAQPFSSHFYGLPADCAYVASYNLPNFSNEGLDFAVTPAIGGLCPINAPIPVYRALRPSAQINVPNHRYSVDRTTYDNMLAQGWSGEGAVFCVTSATPPNPRPVFVPASSVKDRCVAPRSGSSPLTGKPYPDRPGTLADELNWVRAFSDETYLWYREIPNLNATDFSNPVDYFNRLKSPAVTFSGLAKDKSGFHYTLDTSEVENTNAGISAGYGISWQMVRNTPPRQLLVAVVDPGSPADLAGIRRGDRVLTVDGVDLVNDNTQSGVNTLNAGVFPATIGETHTLVLAPLSGGASKTAVLRSAQLALQPVPVSGVINTASGKVGYLAFTTFNSFVSESAVANAIAGLQAAGVNDLVLDLRYNRGGYLYVASQLAYMIAGPARTAGRNFEIEQTNDKKPFGPDDVLGFLTKGSGYPGGLASGQSLPTLNLPRVFVLTTGSSCSASEALINGLRGIDVQVILIGSGATCGKPFGFYGTDNCGTTYFTVQFTGVNAKGEGGYVDGFAPSCTVADDLGHALGDPSEAQLAGALAWRATGACQAAKAGIQRFVEPSASGLALGDARFELGGNKRMVAPDVRRDGGAPLTPRSPSELGARNDP